MNDQAEVKAELKEMRVRHRSKPAEPFAQSNAVGVVCRTNTDTLRITPAWRNIPAMAYVSWADGDYSTWERLSDLIEIGKPK